MVDAVGLIGGRGSSWVLLHVREPLRLETENKITVWKTLDLENLKLLQKLNYREMGVKIYISCSYGTYEWCVKTIL